MKPIRVALIPAYCPDEILCDLLHELSLREFFIIVVNDGSSQEFTPVFEEASRSAVILTHHDHLGKGAALRTGLAYLQEHFPFHYTVVTLDPDGNDRLSDAERLCRTVEAQPDALVLGCRDLKQKIPFATRFQNRVSSLLFRLTSGKYIKDTRTGLRAFSDRLTPEMLTIPGEQDGYELKVLKHFARTHNPILEIQTHTLFCPVTE